METPEDQESGSEGTQEWVADPSHAHPAGHAIQVRGRSRRDATIDPKSIGPYHLIRCLGQGGMGSVWLARQIEPVRRDVAIKLIRGGISSQEVVARFDGERQALAMMDHPNIAKILDAGVAENGQPYFAMELVAGEPLGRFCDRFKLSIVERLALFQQVCAGVQHAHQKGIVHRDLKPGNVIVSRIDGRPHAKVIDFGLAKAMDGVGQLSRQSVQTVAGQVLGTLKYMSPEQASLDNNDIDTRSDIYSLGLILYDLLCGLTPLDDQSLSTQPLLKLLERIREEPACAPSNRFSTLPKDLQVEIATVRATEPTRLANQIKGDLDLIVLKAVDKERDQRYTTAHDLAADIERYLSHEPVLAHAPSRRYRVRKFITKHRIAALFSSLFLAVLLTGSIGTSVGFWQAVKAREAEARRANAEQLAKDISQKRLSQIERSNDILSAIFRDLDIREVRSEQKSVESVLAEKLIEAGQQITLDIIGDRETVAKLHQNLGQSLLNLGFASDAIEPLKRSESIRSTDYGASDLRTLKSRSLLGEAMQMSGEPGKALSIFEDLRDSYARMKMSNHPDAIEAMNNQAECLRTAGRNSEAIPLLVETLEKRRETFGDDHIKTITSINNLALAYLDSGAIAEALDLLNESLQRTEAVLGDSHPTTIAILNNLASAHGRLDQTDLAIGFLERAVAATEKRMGPEHPDTLRVSCNLATFYARAEKRSLAISVFKRVLPKLYQKLGEDNIDTLTAEVGLADCLLSDEQFEQSIIAYQSAATKMDAADETLSSLLLNCIRGKSLALWSIGKTTESIETIEQGLRRIAGSYMEIDLNDQPDAVSLMIDLGVLYRENGKFRPSIELFERAKLFADDPSIRSQILAELRASYARAGDKEKVMMLINEELQKLRGSVSSPDPEIASYLVELASDLMMIGNHADAVPLLREALSIRQKNAPGSWVVFNTQSMLGESIAESASDSQGKESLIEAGSLLKAGYEGLCAVETTIPALVRETRLVESLTRLVRYSQISGDSDAETQWRKKIDELAPD